MLTLPSSVLFCLVVRSAFRGFTYDGATTRVAVKSNGPIIYAHIWDASRPPSALFRHDSEYGFYDVFLHNNFTLFHVKWGGTRRSTDDKIDIFKDMIDWLSTFNQTLAAKLVDDDDFLAWNIAAFDS